MTGRAEFMYAIAVKTAAIFKGQTAFIHLKCVPVGIKAEGPPYLE